MVLREAEEHLSGAQKVLTVASKGSAKGVEGVDKVSKASAFVGVKIT